MVSVIVPVFNTEEFLAECIESILGQSMEDIELILVDDGSTDSSMDIMEKYASTDKRVRIIKRSHCGPFQARKAGVKAANGEYITFADSDDFIDSQAYILAADDMAAGIDIIMFGMCRYLSRDDMRFGAFRNMAGIYDKEKMNSEIYPIMLWDKALNKWGVDPALCNKLYKRDLLLNVYENVDDFKYHFGEDVVLSYPLLYEASSLSIHNEVYYYHRQRTSNLNKYICSDDFFEAVYNIYASLRNYFSDNEIIMRQLDMYYISRVNLKNKTNRLLSTEIEAVFPFDKVEKGDRVIIYGAGNYGHSYIHQINKTNYCNVVLWTDTNYKSISDRVSPPLDILKTEYDKIVIAVKSNSVRENIKKYLKELGASQNKII